MEEKYYTIKELANIFDVTRQAIQFLLKKEEYQPYLSKQRIKGRTLIVINNEGYQLLKDHFMFDEQANNTKETNKQSKNNASDTSKKQTSKTNDNLLQDTIKTLKKELEHAHKELESVHTELQHEQELHLIDKKQLVKEKEHITELQQQVKKLKLLQEKQDEQTKEKQTSQNEQTNNKKDTNKTSKHWWQFWK